MQRLEILNTQSKPFSDNQASWSRGGGQDVGGVGGEAGPHQPAGWRGLLFLFAEGPRVWEVEQGTVHFRPLLRRCSTSGPTACGKGALPRDRGRSALQEKVARQARPFQRTGWLCSWR